MYFLNLILMLLLILVIAFFYKLANIEVQFDTNQNRLILLFYWLYPLLKAEVETKNSKPILTIYLFKKRIFSKNLKLKKGHTKNLALSYYKYLVLRNSKIEIYYGLNNPFLTAMANGFIGIIQTYINNIPITHVPDFVPSNDYIVIYGSTQLNIGKTLIQIIRKKLK